MTLPPLVDTHCHLVLLEERGLLQRALEGAHSAGVTQLVTIGVNLDDSERNRMIAEANDGVWFTVGWDPQQQRPPDAAELRALDELATHPRCVGVGEVGLDVCFRLGYHETPLDVQRAQLHVMLELARTHDLPVVIHDRDAHAEILAALRDVAGTRGVMHCFTGDAAHAQQCVALGFRISFSGIVTFRNAVPIQAAARNVVAGAFVVETDAPFLAPVPHRGEVNLPEHVAVTARFVAQLRDVPEHAVREETTAAARALFALPDAAAVDAAAR